MKITVLGSINIDHVIHTSIFPKPGETVCGGKYHIAYGGKGANQTVACARMGAKTHFIACIGEDQFGVDVCKSFVKDEIDINNIVTIPDQMTGVAMIQVNDNTGENSIVISPGANQFLDESMVLKARHQIESSDALLMQLETPLNGLIVAAKLAKSSNRLVVLNPAPAQQLPDELLQNIDIITPNETETEILTGIKVTDQISAQTAAQIFHNKGIKLVLITLGEKGVFLSESNKEGRIITGFRVRAVDTTAAGDTFNGAFLSTLLTTNDIDKAITIANAAAAISVTRYGAQPSIPYYQEVIDFLNQE